jgi:hypothetical protein
MGPLAVSVEELAILNNLDPEQEVRTGELVKVVVPGRRR